MISFFDRHVIAFSDYVARQKYISSEEATLLAHALKVKTIELYYEIGVATIAVKVPRDLISSMMNSAGQATVLKIVGMDEYSTGVSKESTVQEDASDKASKRKIKRRE